MMSLRAVRLFLSAILPAVVACCSKTDDTAERRAVSDDGYLRQLARETWDWLDRHRDARTGFSTDSQEPGGRTNTTNIGLYLACLGPAVEMGFLAREEAAERARQILASLSRLEARRGFLPNLVSVEGATALEPGVSAVSDFNKLVAGLVLARQYFPELAGEVSPLIGRIEWGWLYNEKTGRGYYGYDLLADRPVGETNFWLAADVRLAVFFLIASGAAPPEAWDRMERREVRADGLAFFWPGYEMGGLFMQAMDGLFLDERGTEVGRSVADFAWHQMRFAASRGLPAWGWSNCNIPGAGYTEGGFLPWNVVTPHASALVLDYYPHRVVQNLRALEALGARGSASEPAPRHGFQDSINLETGEVSPRRLALDQAMIFLALANHLENNTVRAHFARDPLVAAGLRTLGCRLEPDPALLEEWACRDAQETPFERRADSAAPDEVVLELGSGKSEFAFRKGVLSENSSIAARRTEDGLLVEFDLGPAGDGEAEIVMEIPPLDAAELGEVVFVASGRRTDGEDGAFGARVYLRDDQRQGQFGYLFPLAGEPAPVSLACAARPGLFANPGALSEITLKLWGRPWYYADKRTGARTGEVLIEKMIFRAKQPKQANLGRVPPSSP